VIFTYSLKDIDGVQRHAIVAGSLGDSFFSMTDILTEVRFMTLLVNYSFICSVKAVGGVPFVVVSSGMSANNCADITPIVNICTTKPRSVFTSEICSQFVSRYGSSGLVFSVDEFEAVVDSVYNDFLPFVQRQKIVPVNLAPLFFDSTDGGVTKQVIDTINASVDPSVKYLGNTPNETVFRQTPFDKLMIKLPRYSEFKNPEIPVESLIPQSSDLFSPFAHPVYYSPLWKLILDQPASMHESILAMYAKDLGVRPDSFKDIPFYPLDEIIGSVDNNGKPVQDYEVDFYNKLVKFIKSDTKNNYGDDAKDLNSMDGLSPEMQDYVYSLIRRITLINWACSGMLPKEYFNLSNDDNDLLVLDDSQSDSDDLSSYTTWALVNTYNLDGFELLLGYIRECAKKLGCTVYASAIVQLSRFGVNRPRCLVFAGCSSVFDLSTFADYIEPVNFDSLVVQQVNGRDYELCGVVTCNSIVDDSAFLNQVGIYNSSLTGDIGAIVIRKFTNGKSQLVYMSLVDIVSDYGKIPPFIDGIDYDGNTFTVDDDKIEVESVLHLAVKDIKGCKDGSMAFYVNESLSEFCQDIGCKAHSLVDLVVLNNILSQTSGGYLSSWYADSKFSSVEELEKLVRDTGWEKSRLAESNIGVYLVQIMLRVVANENDSGYFVDKLNAAKDVMKDMGISSVTDFFGSVPEKKDTDYTFQHLKAFGTADVLQTPVQTKEVSIMSQLINPVKIGSSVYPIMAGNEVIMYMGIDKSAGGSQIFTLMSKSEADICNVVKLDSSQKVLNLTHFVWVTLNHILSGTVEKSQVKFNSADSLKQASSYISKHWKELVSGA
jgi:hypothetical protein